MTEAIEKRIRFRYRRRGGVRQLVLTDGEQLRGLKQVDARNWIVLSAPARGHEIDDASLQAIDTGGDGRIRVQEILDAIRWLETVIVSFKDVPDGVDSIQAGELRTDTPEARKIAISLEALSGLFDETPTSFTLQHLAKGVAKLREVPLNGDGFIDARVTENEALRGLIELISGTMQTEQETAVSDGVNKEMADSFYRACDDYRKWHETGADPQTLESLFPLGSSTEPAAKALMAIKDKVDSWFTLCQTNLYAPDLVKSELSAESLADRPIAPLNEAAILELSDGCNPAWRERIDQFLQAHFPDSNSRQTSYSEKEWKALCDRFSPYIQWSEEQPGSEVSALGIERINQCLGDAAAREALYALLEEDKRLEDKLEGVRMLERLLLLKRDFWEILHNFVNFDQFYDLKSQAIFQVGELYLDGRSFHLCLPVQDLKSHVALAGKSGIHLLYCRLSRHGISDTPLVVAAVTSGNHKRLMPGKHGVFYDRLDEEWDAQIVQIVEHPINLQQAILEPFKRLGSLLVSQIDKLSASGEKTVQTQISGGFSAIEDDAKTLAQESKPVEKAPSSTGGLLAGGGVAIAAIASSFAFFTSTLSRMHPIHMVYGIVVVLLLILIPTTILAIIRLRNRDIGPLLEAGGWAINAHMRLTHRLGNQLTQLARRRS